MIPLPDPTKATGLDGLFSFADADNNYTFWLADVEYADVPTTTLGARRLGGHAVAGDHDSDRCRRRITR